jgi:hypothetical protein
MVGALPCDTPFAFASDRACHSRAARMPAVKQVVRRRFSHSSASLLQLSPALWSIVSPIRRLRQGRPDLDVGGHVTRTVRVKNIE